MKTLFITAAALVLASMSHLAIADKDMKADKEMMMGGMIKKMDTNADGMLSKEEFMSGHEKMFDRMKGQNGMIAMSDMPMNCMGMMGKGGMMEKGHQMPHGMEKGMK